ncbi:hypothetical protein [Leptospira brenneri]|uniref:hypothetical protein n=1 Tax=Leptospira brenneri TaxID=2023182 RepID=UPI000C2A72EA|nr:hypothetical protein [Leptospira brenneri]PJZ43653.1 hypothetical protein CH361_19315 [Leptospira brenneri]
MQEIFKNQAESEIIEIERYLKEDRTISNEPYSTYIKEFKNFLNIYKTLLSISVKHDLNDSIVSQLTNYYGKEIKKYITELYELQTENINGENIYGSINNFLLRIYELSSSPIQGAKPFPSIASFILSLDSKSIDTLEYERIKNDLREKVSEFEKLIPALQDQASKISIINYAKLFGEQGKLHSNFTIIPFRIAAAETWLLAAIFSAIALLYTVFFFNMEYKLNDFNNILKSDLVIAELLKRGFLLTFELFIIRFSIRNYNINKNLHIANIHRQNVLNSFRLLYDSIPFEDSNSKSKLMEEVSKSIFFLGTNPYIVDKKSEKINLETIAELTKLIKN